VPWAYVRETYLRTGSAPLAAFARGKPADGLERLQVALLYEGAGMDDPGFPTTLWTLVVAAGDPQRKAVKGRRVYGWNY
jgi:hypothetical protein